MTSTGPPAGKGTKSLIGRVGYFFLGVRCAQAGQESSKQKIPSIEYQRFAPSLAGGHLARFRRLPASYRASRRPFR